VPLPLELLVAHHVRPDRRPDGFPQKVPSPRRRVARVKAVAVQERLLEVGSTTELLGVEPRL